jgi:hypothetical protein
MIMKTIGAYEVIRAILATKDRCEISDIVRYREEYYNSHPDEDICFEIYRDAIFYDIYRHNDELYWDYKNGFIIRQETIYCPICGSKYYKYPENEMFNNMKVLMNLQINSLNLPLESNE